MKRTSLFVVLTLITVLGAGTAGFAVCTTTTLTTAPGVWGIESQGTGPGGLTNYLMQVTFTGTGTSKSSPGSFTGTQWESVAGTFSGPTAISGTWFMVSPASYCQGTMTVTTPSQNFNFALDNAGKGGNIVQIDSGYDQAGFMVAQGVIKSCTNALSKNKQFSLYSYGNITAAGGTVTGTGELKFNGAIPTGTITAIPTVSLDLHGAGNFTIPASGSYTTNANCTGSGSLTTAVGTFDSVSVIVSAGKEILWIVTDSGDNVTGYFLQ